MNYEEVKTYLGQVLPDFDIEVNRRWKDKPNDRYVFKKDGVEAAMLFSQKLSISREFLNDVASAVKKRFDSPEAIDKTINKKLDEEESVASDAKVAEDIPGKPSELELMWYNHSKIIVEQFEKKYPMS